MLRAVIAIIKIPIWLVSLLTPAKSFRDNPVIGSRTLNTLGLHVFRILLARIFVWLRWIILSPLVEKAKRQQFHREGFMVFEDFISPEQVSDIRREIRNHSGETRQMIQGDTATQRFLLDDANLAHKPALATVTKSKILRRALSYGAASLNPPLLYIQRIRNALNSGKPDPQKNMHADTFHPTMKAWLFLEDVTADKGPFTYVRGSNRMTWARLKWEYKRSLKARQNPDGYSEKGSFRATADDLTQMGLPVPEGLTAKAGTLVVADTNGFHGRGQAKASESRLEIWAYSRPTPFNPLPGFPFKWLDRVQMSVLKSHWRRKDTQAAHRNSKASWHLIPANQMTDLED